VVGTAVFPSLADQLNLGHGALVTVGALKDTAGNQAPPPDTILVHFRPGTDQRAMVARLNQQVGKLSPDFNASVPWQPVDLVNFGRVRDLPILVGGLLAALAIGTLVHLLATSIRSRRRDLAILKVLGFVPRQVRRTIGWQANTIAVLALVAGIPLGLVIGRWLWLAFSDQLGVRTVTRVPWLAGVALVVAVLVAAQLVALVPARAAAHTDTSRALRPPR